MKDNPLVQAMREKSAGPVDFGRMMQMIEEIHAMLKQDAATDQADIVTTQQSHS